MAGLEGLPGWALKLHENTGRFSQAGLTGLVDHASVTNPLGELLARGGVTTVQVQEFLDSMRKSVVGVADVATAPQNFWTVAWNEILGESVVAERKIVVPPFPTIKVKTQTAMTGGFGTWIPVFLPAELTEADYPADFIKPAWGKYLTESDIKRRPLPGRWVMVETINKPNWDDQNGYGNGTDPLAEALGLTTRFKVSWDDLHETHLPKVAKVIGLSKKAVRPTTAEEWQWIAYVFLWLNTNRNTNLPNLGSTNSWEWCENTYGGARRLLVGRRVLGGLAGVGSRWRGGRDGSIGFRVLVVL